jgi:hypothetical protein
MRIAIVGAGALGSVYGARLACLDGCEISVVGRAAGPPKHVRLERVDGGDVLGWEMPARVERIPSNTEVAIACTRYEQLGDLPVQLEGNEAPVVVMTPMLPADSARLSALLPRRVRPGMPSVVSYRSDERTIRYWLPRTATTLVQGSAPSGPEAELVSSLERVGIRAAMQVHVLERNAATTVSFLPLAMSLDVAGSIDRLLDDHALLQLAIDATAEGRELGRTIGKAEAWATTLLRFVGPLTLKMCVALARARASEAVYYVEQHFGRKLHLQNVAMARGIVELAREKRTRARALAELSTKLESGR